MQSLISIMVLPICRVVQNCLRYSKGGGAKKFGVQKGGGQNFYVGKGGQKRFTYPNVRPNFFRVPKGMGKEKLTIAHHRQMPPPCKK